MKPKRRIGLVFWETIVVLKLDNGGKPFDRIPSDADLGIRRPPPK